MSGFLANLLRRGAGLPPLVAPRRMDLPADLPVPDGEEDQEGLSPAVSAPPEPERRSPETSVSPAPPVPAKAAEAPRTALVPPEAPLLALAPPREQAIQTPASPRPAPEPPPEPAAPFSPQQDDRPREAPEMVRVIAAPPPSPPPFTISSETPEERITAPPVQPPLPAPAPPPAKPAVVEPVLLAPISPPPETPAALHALDEARPPEEPRIEVRIGRIEIRQAPPPPLPAPAPRREPRGFQEHSLARRYLDRRWY